MRGLLTSATGRCRFDYKSVFYLFFSVHKHYVSRHCPLPPPSLHCRQTSAIIVLYCAGFTTPPLFSFDYLPVSLLLLDQTPNTPEWTGEGWFTGAWRDNGRGFCNPTPTTFSLHAHYIESKLLLQVLLLYLFSAPTIPSPIIMQNKDSALFLSVQKLKYLWHKWAV